MCVVLAFFTRNNASNSHLEASTVQGWTNYRARVDKKPPLKCSTSPGLYVSQGFHVLVGLRVSMNTLSKIS